MVWPTSLVQQTTGFLSGPIFSFETQEHLCLHSMCFLSWWILPPTPAPWRWAVSSCSTSMALIEGKERESCCFYVYIYATGLLKVAAVSTSVKAGAGGEGQAQEFSISSAAGERRPPWCRRSEEGFIEEGCASWVNTRAGFIPTVVIYIDMRVCGGDLIKLNIYLKNPQTLLELDLFADTGICHKWWFNFHLLFQKKIHFIPDSQGVIAKELFLVRALQIHPALQYSDEISLHYYYYYRYCYNCYYCYICASIDCIFIGIGILVLVLVLELGIECWLWDSLSFLYTQFLSYLVLKEVKEVCLDLSNRQAAEFFLFTLRGDWRTFALRLSFLHMRGQRLWEGFVACLWLLKASLARWRKLPFRSGWKWEKTSNN